MSILLFESEMTNDNKIRKYETLSAVLDLCFRNYPSRTVAFDTIIDIHSRRFHFLRLLLDIGSKRMWESE